VTQGAEIAHHHAKAMVHARWCQCVREIDAEKRSQWHGNAHSVGACVVEKCADLKTVV
jgi:hypothetical protein